MRMSASRSLAAMALVAGGLVWADEVDVPEMDFIEYLGMWEESDEEWLIIDSQQLAKESDERIDPVPQGEESTESSDEG